MVAALSAPLVAFYYGAVASPINGRVVSLLVPRLRVGRQHPALAVDAAMRVAVGGLLQVLFFVALLLVTRLGWSDLMAGGISPVLVSYGVVLGLAELALASFFCNVAMRVAITVVPERVPPTREGWYAMSRGGWMRSFLAARRIAPLPLALAGAILYVSVEECVFRGVLISVFDRSGFAVALAISVGLFITAQTFNMPSFANALFPMIGALVVGVTHGVLFLAYPNMTPLVVAHVVLFVGGVL